MIQLNISNVFIIGSPKNMENKKKSVIEREKVLKHVRLAANKYMPHFLFSAIPDTIIETLELGYRWVMHCNECSGTTTI